MGNLPHYFGRRAWGPAVDDPEAMVEPPVGEPCLDCGEAIMSDDAGLITWFVSGYGQSSQPCAVKRAQHRECFLRNVLGSVGHQSRRCSCYGGNEEDPPGMTKREAARAACRHAGVEASIR